MSTGRKKKLDMEMKMEMESVKCLQGLQSMEGMEEEGRRMEEEDSTPDPDALMSRHELRTLYKVVCHLERWPAGTMSLTDLKELKELVKTRLAAMGEGNHPDGDVNAILG